MLSHGGEAKVIACREKRAEIELNGWRSSGIGDPEVIYLMGSQNEDDPHGTDEKLKYQHTRAVAGSSHVLL